MTHCRHFILVMMEFKYTKHIWPPAQHNLLAYKAQPTTSLPHLVPLTDTNINSEKHETKYHPPLIEILIALNMIYNL